MTKQKKPTLMVIDGHSLAFRAFYALPVDSFVNGEGQHTNAIHGCVSMLLSLLRDERPSHLAVAFDISRQSFRTREYPDYKGTRAETPAEFKGQVPLLQDVLRAMGIQTLTKEDYEADDILATLARQGHEQGFDVLVVSGDRDSIQLVNDEVTLLYPSSQGVSKLKRYTPETVMERYGVRPEQYPDVAALVGETSDNLPGVPKVGEKTAAKWLGQYGSLDELIARADEVTGKVGESLREHLDDVRRNRRLNRLVDDVDLPVGPADLERGAMRRDAIRELFARLEFNQLLTRVLKQADADGFDEGSDDDAAQKLAELPTPAELLDEELERWLAAQTKRHGAIALQVEVTPDAEGEPARVHVGLATPEGRADLLLDTGRAEYAPLIAWLADARAPKVMHDAKPQLKALHQAGIETAGLAADTQLMAWLLRPADLATTRLLDQLVIRELGETMPLVAPSVTGAPAQPVQPADPEGQPAKAEPAVDAAPGAPDAFASSPTADGQAAEDASSPAEGDLASAPVLTPSAAAWYIARLAPLLREQLPEGLARVHDEIEIPTLEVLVGMELRGIAIDLPLLDALSAELSERAGGIADDAYAMIGHEVNLGSPKQLQTVLFDELDMPKTRKTKTGFSTNAEALADLQEQHPHPFLAQVLLHRDATKLRQITDTLREAVREDARIHTTYVQAGTATGRLSSTDPNLQNIPVRTPEGRRIREAFVHGTGTSALMTVDYSQIEMRIMAHLSEDPGLIEAYRSGEDLHRFVGARVFDVEPAEVTPLQRSRVKAMSYGLAYGLSAFGLSKQLRIPTAEAKTLMSDYFERFGGVRDYLRSVVEDATRTGYTETIFGRRRLFPELSSTNRMARENAQRQALNAPIQGSAADIMKIAMVRVADALAREQLESRMLLQVHDELIFEVAPGEEEALARLVREGMGGAASLRVPLEVSVGVGPNWNAAAHD